MLKADVAAQGAHLALAQAVCVSLHVAEGKESALARYFAPGDIVADKFRQTGISCLDVGVRVYKNTYTACARKNTAPKHDGIVFEILGKHH